MATMTKVAEFLSILSENFKAAPSPAMAKIIGEKLKPFSDQQLVQGLDCLLSNRVYLGFPTVAEILNAVRGGSVQELLEVEAEAAFNLVLYLRHDVHGSPYPRDVGKLSPVTQAALRQMGGTTSSWTIANLDFKRRTFIEIYSRLARNPEKLQELGYESRPALP